MWTTIFSSVQNAIDTAWSWFYQLFDAVPGSWQFLFVVIIIFLIVRLVLAPLTSSVLRSGVSDQVSGRAHARSEKAKNDWVEMEKRKRK